MEEKQFLITREARAVNWHNELLQAKSWLRWAQEKLNWHEPVDMFFHGRLTSRGGDANPRHMRIRLSPHVWEHGTEATRRNTTLHEFAHLYAYWKHSDCGHGYWWKRTMIALGLEPKRCHSIITPQVAARRAKRQSSMVSVYCGCREHKVTKQLAGRMRNGRRYSCKYCRTRIVDTKPVNAIY